MTKPSLSIVLVVNNAEATLSDSIHRLMDYGSELATTFDVLVIDDDSMDDTLNVASDLARKFPQVRVHHNPVSGHTEFIQLAIRRTQGEYVLICDGEMTVDEIRHLWSLRVKEEFVMASVFANQVVVRTSAGDEVIPTEMIPSNSSRLIYRQKLAVEARYDQAHQDFRPASPPVYLRPLNSRMSEPNL